MRSVLQAGEVSRGAVAPTHLAFHGSGPHRIRGSRIPVPNVCLSLVFVLGATLPEDRITTVFEGFHHASSSPCGLSPRG
jgi:hypothetical protein